MPKLASRRETYSSTMEDWFHGSAGLIKSEVDDAGPMLSASLNSELDWNINGLGDVYSESEDMRALFPCGVLDSDILDDPCLFGAKDDFSLEGLSSGAGAPPPLTDEGDLGYCGGDSLMSELADLMDQDVTPSSAAPCPPDAVDDYDGIMATGHMYHSTQRPHHSLHAASQDEELTSALGSVSPSSLLLPKTDAGELSPSYASSESSDSGVSSGEASPPGAGSDLRLSPDREEGWSASCSPSSPCCSARLSPPSSLSSPQLSPSSSPTASLHSNASRPTRNLIVGTTSSYPQFITEKRPKYTFTTTAGRNCNTNSTTAVNKSSTISATVVGSSTSSMRPLTVLTTSTTSSMRAPSTAAKMAATLITRPVHKASDATGSSKSNTGVRALQKSSPSPSVVTLSGVNKTAGIIKSPSVISVSRKHTFGAVHSGAAVGTTSGGSNTLINSNNGTVIGTIQQQAPKPIAVISPSGEVVATNTSTGSQLFKTMTVSTTNGRLTTASGQQIIFAPRSIVSGLPATKIVKSGHNILVPFDPKSMDKLRTIKIVSSKSGGLTAAPAVRTVSTVGGAATILRSTSSSCSSSSSPSTSPSSTSSTTGLNFITSSRTRTLGIAGLPSTSRPGTVSILKNVCVPLDTKGAEGSYASVVSLPKQEGLDSDEEMEFPKKNEPLVLTEEEQKLVLKENVKLPSHFPLTKRQERDLKRIKRKIRNKISAQDSRKRKKEYMDKLEETIQERTRENDRLKLQMATLEETNKQLTEQLQKFQDMMNASRAAPTLASSTHHHHHHNTRQQQHPSAFLLMMILSAALFIYPSVLPQGKTGSDLLAAMPHKMPPAGNSRSLLEAATAKLSVCQEGDDFEEELKLEKKLTEGTKLRALDVLSDHDYAPPHKRGRFELSLRDDNFCSLDSDERLTPPRKKGIAAAPSFCAPPVEDVLEIKEEALSPPPVSGDLDPIPKKAVHKAAPQEVKGAAESGGPASKGAAEVGDSASKGAAELLAALSGGASDYWEKLRSAAVSAMLGSLAKPHNRTVEPSGGALHDVASQLVVELKGKRFREDLELE